MAGSYLDRIGKIPADPWGNEYRYEVNGDSFLIRSAGPDRKFGSDDDIVKEPVTKEE